MKKRIIPLLLCLVLALSVLFVLPTNADAASPQQIIADAEALESEFPTSGNYPADCPVCDKEVTWKPLTSNVSANCADGDHYYMPASFSNNNQIFLIQSNKKICVHTNGKTLTGKGRFCLVGGGCELNIMGTGMLQSELTSTTMGVLYSNGTGRINVYGTTIKSNSTAGHSAIHLYKKGGTVNAYNCELIAENSPSVITNGTVNLYDCTVNGQAAEVGGSSGDDGTNGKLNLIGTTITGINVPKGSVTVSGKTKITGTGLKLAAGKVIDPTNLTTGASIAIANKGVFTAAGMESYAQYFTAVDANCDISTTDDGALRCWPNGAVLVTADGTETPSDDVLTDWATGSYAFIKLYGDDSFAMEGQDILIDLAGFDLTVTGTGNIRAFDSANDGYDKNACGTILNNGTVTFTEAVAAPNGNRYVTVKESNRATAHRLDIKLTSVSLRTTAAGLYYKAKYTCDSVLAEKVKAYGMIVSVDNMPGADYENDGTDVNKYTVAAAPFQSGVTATSGSIFGIMKDSRDAETNDEYARIPIYANAYIDLGNGPIVADIDNPGKTVDDSAFTGTALSLYDVMQKLDAAYNNYNTTTRLQLDNFYFQWKEKGMDWDFDYIGQTAGTTDAVDNSDLVFDEGTTDAECPVCKTKVTWTALNDTAQGIKMTGHYYLTDDLTYTGTASAVFWNENKTTSLCVHLNGHDLTATKTRVVHGSSGRVNVMGNGDVTGCYANSGEGTTVRGNNYLATNSVHLYGGTYKKSSNSHSSAAPVSVQAAGGAIYIYEGATVENTNGVAIIIKTPTNENSVKAELGLYGCTVNGDIELNGGDASYNAAIPNTEFVDCIVNGNVTVKNNTAVYLAGAPVIKSITLQEDALLNTKVLTDGASIGIATDGIFTVQSESVKNYTSYFHGTNAASVISVRDNALHCGPDYAGDLKFEEGTTNAVCPVCAKVVTWTPVDGSAVITNTAANHYYLTNDVTFTAANGESSFLSPGHGDYHVCFHLNGHNFTGTNTRFVYGGTSIVNIMGSGTVSCARGDGNKYGSTIQTNTSNIRGEVNLYGGIWTQEENGTYTASDYVISMSDNGGTINVHEDAAVVANSNGKAIYLGTCNLRDTIAGIYGTVKGDIYAAGANQSKGFASYITVDNGTVEGTLDINGVNTVTISHAAKIQLLDMEETSLVTMNAMTQGANVTVLNEGVFTEPHDSAADWADYFHAANKNDLIAVKENALCYKVNYTSKLYPDAEGKAYCPVCKEIVQWTAVSSGESRIVAENGKHYYLTADILYEGEYSDNIAFFNAPSVSGSSVCLHLNGNNITATKCHGIYGGYGVLNVMGEGVVTGYSSKDSRNAAVQINNRVISNALNLYSGTYRKSADSVAAAGVVGIEHNGSRIRIYEDVNISNPGGTAIALGTSYINSNLEIYGATIAGNITVAAPSKSNSNGDYKAILLFEDVTVNGEVNIAAGNEVTLDGRTKIGKLTLAAGQLVTFTNMLDGSDITVSADGVFTPHMELADEWLPYITCADEGDWIIVRDKQFYQEAKQEITAATDDDKTALNTTYAGTTIRYGEMHNHTNSGPYRDDGTGTSPSTGADGKNSLAEWIEEMDRLKMDFAFIVDHGMSIHMYHENFLPDYFVGGTEPGTTITDSNANSKGLHYNMLFAYPDQLESIFFKWEEKFQPIKWNAENYPTAQNPSEDGYRVKYPKFTTEEFGQLAKDVYDAGGLLVQVHPKYDSYLNSDDPMDYYFADYSGFEIITGSGGNMMYKDNNEAYETWVDLLELDKKIWATAGSDRHRLPDISGMTVMYTVNDHKNDYMAAVRAGNMAPGWIGIRMNVNGTAMGGETAFEGQRLQFSVGDIYNTGVKDYVNTPDPYVEGHTYRVELYDDGGILMSSTIDPTQMNYFAIDCDANAKFYRIVVWDETDNERIGVSNPIWNTAVVEE